MEKVPTPESPAERIPTLEEIERHGIYLFPTEEDAKIHQGRTGEIIPVSTPDGPRFVIFVRNSGASRSYLANVPNAGPGLSVVDVP